MCSGVAALKKRLAGSLGGGWDVFRKSVGNQKAGRSIGQLPFEGSRGPRGWKGLLLYLRELGYIFFSDRSDGIGHG
jgi:hypothetical protein